MKFTMKKYERKKEKNGKLHQRERKGRKKEIRKQNKNKKGIK